MAFYSDELSPIDRIRNPGKATELSDINVIKSRRQWKSLVLGKKDMGINNFATITEEKEEEISSDGNSSKESNSYPNLNYSVLLNKKITFPKPRKYITSRVSERKEDSHLTSVKSPVLPTPLGLHVKESLAGDDKKKINVEERSNALNNLRTNLSETRSLLKLKKSREPVLSKQELFENSALNEISSETQWNDLVSETDCSLDLEKIKEKINVPKCESIQILKSKQDDKKKFTGNTKSVSCNVVMKEEAKVNKKKVNLSSNKGGQSLNLAEKTSSVDKPEKIVLSKDKQKTEKGKMLNMKDVVNVYKNLTYGSKEEIKSFVQNLSFVQNDSKTEENKNLLSVMNLKALENKIKNFTKKNSKYLEVSVSQSKKSKTGKPVKKNRKAHIERLARHKVVKVPAVLNNNQVKNNVCSVVTESEKGFEQKSKKLFTDDKEPWKYVGTQSVLDKTYFVYPTYPPSINLKKKVKSAKNCTKGKVVQNNCESSPVKEKKGNEKTTALKSSNNFELRPKVKAPEIIIRQSLFNKGNAKERIRSGVDRSMNTLNISRSMSNKSINRSSATTVCTIEFRPEVNRKTLKTLSVENTESTDPGLLVYLHGTKAINVKSPYSNKQFSRVKLFRTDEKGMPLIKGLSRKVSPKGYKTVSIKNISLPEKLTRVRSLDLIDFDEDIQNITDFLHSQNSPGQDQEETLGSKRRNNHNNLEPAYRQQCQQGRTPQSRRQNHHNHQHGIEQETLSPDSIINEISKNIEHLKYLPDTEENRKMIGQFFDELYHRIEDTKHGQLTIQKFPSFVNSYNPIPILGY